MPFKQLKLWGLLTILLTVLLMISVEAGAQNAESSKQPASSEKMSVAKLNLAMKGPFNISASDPKEKYGKLVPELVYANTSDFRSRYECRKIK